ncbi:MAG: FHA domain-containing protein [Myxococcota bacterium]
MISVVISEKGGAERREAYDHNEITIGRVKGNDVMLPKGNVSKRHARLILRDGRYIVTDLKSTNGTYVNHRRITHATLVRAGDRIYIGDFILRIEGSPEETGENRIPRDSIDIATHDGASSSSEQGISMHPFEGAQSNHDVVSHFPIERDPDEDSSRSLDLPGPPRIPRGLASSVEPLTGSRRSSDIGLSPETGEATHLSAGSGPTNGVASNGTSSRPDEIQRQRAQQHAHDLVVRAVEDEVDDAFLGETEPRAETQEMLVQAVDAAIERARQNFADSVEVAAVRASALSELAGRGPLTALIEDDQVDLIRIMAGMVVARRRGQEVHGLGFASDAGVERALARTLHQCGMRMPDGPEIEVDLGDELTLFALKPPASPDGHLVTIRRRVHRPSTLDMLVRQGAISRGMAGLLDQCARTRANMLIVGEEAGSLEVLDALTARATRRGQTLWVSSTAQDGPAPGPSMVLGSDDDTRRRRMGLVAELDCHQVVFPPLKQRDLAQLLDVLADGMRGVLMRVSGATLRQAFNRLAADASAARPGLTVPTTRELLGANFDLGLEVARLEDGRLRVIRLAEFRRSHQGVEIRDVFSFAYHHTAPGGSVEGSFQASGTVPRIVTDLAARGMSVDVSVFRRHPTSG